MTPQRRQRLARHTIQPLAALVVLASLATFGAHLIASVVDGLL